MSRASYYRAWGVSEPRQAETELRDRIQKLSLEYPQHGSRRIAKLLSAEGVAVNRKRVQRLMREDNLLVLRKRRYVVTTDARHNYAVYPNLAGEIKPAEPNRLWVADITYIRLRESFVYLAVILDAWSRLVVGWSLGETLTADLALEALDKALEGRVITQGIVHHSDRGVQYCSNRYIDKLRDYRFEISMSRSGNPYDNAMAESFMRTLKCEEVYLTEYRDLNDAKQRLTRFLEDYYNRRRLHSSLGYLTPEDYERKAQQHSDPNTEEVAE